MTKHIRGCGGMADAADSKSADHKSCGFKSHQPHQKTKGLSQIEATLIHSKPVVGITLLQPAVHQSLQLRHFQGKI